MSTLPIDALTQKWLLRIFIFNIFAIHFLKKNSTPTLHPGDQDLIDENALTKFQLFLPNDLSKDSRRFTHARMMEIRYFNKCTKQ